MTLSKLRCPVSGERLTLEAGALVSESRKHRYELHAGRIPLFAEAPASADARYQQRHYDQLAPLYLENLGYPHTEEYVAYLDRIFLESLGEGWLGCVAELCCGQGEALSLLSERVDQGVGVDISVAMLETATARLADERFVFLQGDATQLPLADACFDHVFAFGPGPYNEVQLRLAHVDAAAHPPRVGWHDPARQVADTSR